MNDDAIDAACECTAALDAIGVRSMIGGSLASAVWGEPRFTRDVDIVAALEPMHVDRLVEALGSGWYADATLMREAVERRSCFNVIRLRGMVKVDVFVPPAQGLHASKWDRVRTAVLDPASGRALAITSPEDIVLQKLDWFRAGGEVSENQWRDVTALLRIRAGTLDDAYLDAWAERMGLSELLDRARRGA
jgi:hypothetical protein